MSDNVFAVRVAQEFNTFYSKIGSLNDLLTTEQGTVVSAINELVTLLSELQDSLESLSDLVNEQIPRIDTLESQVEYLYSWEEKQDERLDTLESSVDALNTWKDNLIDDENIALNTIYSSAKIEQLVSDSVQKLKDDLLNGAGDAYDTLKELADLILDNQDAIKALQDIAAGCVRFDTEQGLSASQRQQARDNIGAASSLLVDMQSTLIEGLQNAVTELQEATSGVVCYDREQGLTREEKEVARTNINASSQDDMDTVMESLANQENEISALQEESETHVAFVSQTLTSDEKEQARTNIGAASSTVMGAVLTRLSTAETSIDELQTDSATHVAFIAQDLTEEQQAQARTNIGASSEENYESLKDEVESSVEDIADLQKATASVVLYTYQDLSDSEQQRARWNIGAAKEDDVSTLQDTVQEMQQTLDKFDTILQESVSYAHTQELTDNEKSCARNNIGAASQESVNELANKITDASGTAANSVTSIKMSGFEGTYKLGSGVEVDFGTDLGYLYNFVDYFDTLLAE